MPTETPHWTSRVVPPSNFHSGCCFCLASASQAAFSIAALAMRWPRTLAISPATSWAAVKGRPTTAGARYSLIVDLAVSIQEYLAPAVLGRPLTAAHEVAGLMAKVRGHRMAKAAIENAAWDAEARQKQ